MAWRTCCGSSAAWNKREAFFQDERYQDVTTGANSRLIDLINTAYEKVGRQVVVLIDEYDAPMLDVAHEKEQLDALRNIMRRKPSVNPVLQL